jgi:hypothetical protein
MTTLAELESPSSAEPISGLTFNLQIHQEPREGRVNPAGSYAKHPWKFRGLINDQLV